MARYDLKLVPDAEPNADGFWIEAEVPNGFDLFKLTPKPGHHVVQARPTQDPRDGGPMHRMADPLPPAPYQFDASWLAEPAPICTHDNATITATGDGTPVLFCPDCGRNQLA